MCPGTFPVLSTCPETKKAQLRGKEFRFPPNLRVRLFREMAKLLSTEQHGDNVIHVVPALGMDAAELERLAANLDTQLGR